MSDRSAIVDRAGATGAVAAVLAAFAALLVPPTAPAAAAAAAPCVAAGMLAVLTPGTSAPQPVGPALTAGDRESVTTDAYTDSTAGTGLTVQRVVIGAAGCADQAGTPGGTSTRATAWSALGGAVGGSTLQVDLVPARALGTGWRLRPNLDGLLVGGKPATLAEGATAALGAWGVLDRPQTIDAGAAAPLRWWKVALEVRVTRAHAGFAAGTRLLFGWVSADRAPAAPAPPVTPPPTTTTSRTTTQPTPTTTTTPAPSKPKAPTTTSPAQPKHLVRKPVAKRPRAHRRKQRHAQLLGVGAAAA